MSIPFTGKHVILVPDEHVTGFVITQLLREFEDTGTMPCGAEFFLDDWKAGKIRIAGVYETRELFEYSGNHYEWAMKTFAKPGAPFSIFYAAAVDDSVWISPNIPKTIEGWIRNALE